MLDDFAPTEPATMHVDINSCFTTIEQQANPFLRGKPVAVAAYVKDYGCILAASYEAKAYGVKTGMRVIEGKRLVRNLIVLPPDPPKYRIVNRQMLGLLRSYTDHISVESIDEMVMGLSDVPIRRHMTVEDIARDIKRRIREEIGEWITVSCGIAPNRYLAKVASGLQKPDGLVTICRDNIVDTFSKMTLTDFCGIKEGNAARLMGAGITTPLAFLRASAKDLKRAFRSITGYHWWLRIHGYEDGVIYKAFGSSGQEDQKSFGQSYALGKPYRAGDARLWQILYQLVMKMGRRLRKDGFVAYGVGVSLMLEGAGHWHTQAKKDIPICTDRDLYRHLRLLLDSAPDRPVKLLAVYCYRLAHADPFQPSLFPEDNRAVDLTRALDTIQDRFGDFVIHPARMEKMEQQVQDRIAFGGVEGLPDVAFREAVTREPY